MMSKIAPAYLASLFAAEDYGGLASLSSMVCASDSFDGSLCDYGLPRPLFLLVEALSWHAQSERSGCVTYFEATPVARQEALRSALAALNAPSEIAAVYRDGIEGWREDQVAARVDRWAMANEDHVADFLWHIAKQHRYEVEAALA